MEKENGREGILTGYRVLDVTDERGLWCGKVLGDYGADVIKIEPPGGDRARDIGPFYKGIPDREKSLFWFFTNTSKRSITLNLETVDGREIFKRLAKTAHFVVESFEPGTMARLGLDYPELEKINPGLVMTAITPYGQSGPYAHYKAEDINIEAMGGQMRLYGEPDRSPARFSQPQAFFHGGLQGALGSVVAHYHRELTGEGQYVDVSCQQGIVLTLMQAAEMWDVNKVNYRGGGPFSSMKRPQPLGPINFRRIWPCKDGHVCFFVGGGAAIGVRRSTEFVAKWANEEGYALEIKDLDWAKVDYFVLPREEWLVIENAFLTFLKTKTKKELFAKAVENALMICPVNMSKDILEDPHLQARGFWSQVEHDELGAVIPYTGPPVRMDKLQWRIQRRAPLIGEHNEEIYIGELGFTREQLTAYRTRGVI
jgi:crotonobetainyl-CoA:carnitine CoA-transferase CaiB-like acyl-CoA transferase